MRYSNSEEQRRCLFCALRHEKNQPFLPFADFPELIEVEIVVGYGTKGTETARYVGVGSYFFNIGETEEVDLCDLKVECIKSQDWTSPYMDPDTEYLRDLNPASAGNLACYTYVNEAFLLDAGCEEPLSQQDLAKVGWWKCPTDGSSLWDIVLTDDTSLKLAKGAKMVNPRTAFLGQFSGTGAGGCNFKFTCAGQVINKTSDIKTAAARYYFFQNYIPTTIKLTDLTVDCIKSQDWTSPYMDPDTEYLRDLNPASAGNLACYTYVNEAFLLDAGCEEPLSAKDLAKVGWWMCPTDGNSLWDVVVGDDTSLKITDATDVEMPAGRAFLGQFSGTGAGGCDFHINFPNPLAPIEK